MLTKICSKCKIKKPLKEFSLRNINGNYKKQSYCKSCSNIYKRLYSKRGSEFLRDYLRKHPCIDCGESDIDVLDFDHVRGIKEFCVTDLVNKSINTINKEIEKCEIRCANCHRKRHARERRN